jgi:hypothetical protein
MAAVTKRTCFVLAWSAIKKAAALASTFGRMPSPSLSLMPNAMA